MIYTTHYEAPVGGAVGHNPISVNMDKLFIPKKDPIFLDKKINVYNNIIVKT